MSEHDLTAINELISTLKSENDRVRDDAVNALVAIGEQAVELLIAALKNQDYRIRRESAKSLGKIGDRRAVEPLIAALEDWDSHSIVVKALGEIGDPRAVRPLFDLLTKGPNPVVSGAEIEVMAIGKCGEPAVEALASLMNKNPAFYVRDEAARALGRIGGSALDTLIKALQSLNSSIRSSAAVGLGESADPRAVDCLIAALEKEIDVYVRCKVVESLGRIGGERAAEALRKWIQVDHPRVKQKAARALGTAIEPQIGRYYLIEVADKDHKRHLALIKKRDYPDTPFGVSYASNFGCYDVLAGKVPLIHEYSPSRYDTDDYLHYLHYFVIAEVKEEDVEEQRRLLA